MKLQRITPTTTTLPAVREEKAIVQAFIQAANDAGISGTQGLAQLLAQYAAKPFAFTPGISPGVKDWQMRTIELEPAIAQVLEKRAAKHGVKVAEAVRQIVRRYLQQEGRL